MDSFDHQYFLQGFLSSNTTKIFAFQCVFCLEKFEIGVNFEKRLLGHYFTNHHCKKETQDPAFEFCPIKVENIEVEELLELPNSVVESDEKFMNDEDYYFSNYDETESQNDEFIEEIESQSKDFKEEVEFKDMDLTARSVKVKDKFDDEFFICAHCDKRFKSKKALHSHILNAHTPFSCSICGKECKHRIAFINHMKGHNDRKKCDQCTRTFSTNKALTIHLTSHKQTNKFHCKTCGMTFGFEREKRAHELLHKCTKEGNLYKCVACNKLKSSIKQIESHYDLVHSNTFRICFKCGKKFKNRNLLNYHTKTVHLGISNRFECEHCNQSFSSKAFIRQHMEFYIANRHCKKHKRRSTRKDLKDNNKIKRTIWPCHHCNVGSTSYKEHKAHSDTVHGGTYLKYLTN